ncbi:pyruvate, phosphate dikinase [Candidatus Shapirobacteria bacterium CG08_land_8_20_14_0_20_39_18]|uniref:Pyruvate, phosphate dikinase n=1 Tax=Candidatus Shapirobacteria bacterium CG08_land_8_20_14_0_20_39_18 TaxID=1974883 RepID=A0A2M6XE79_9BACT|nr:MAG: pyruvate, phosphate dikinase [Candidatus Shapirobacteria bacterium CG08_land_8_20_14_0_20_39_18]PIY64722.1 MAG: pyruvate, phosphate dikinase [Candidatus Shapirobacteria bacterium CG_4_10_14_0_8_um_filter_39_15]PJE68674.1 MAG: pyruvate, phosphate dikinase [Candidatus Shapirobacteria bacterium CG10_big_fil_rev_8_21_14_0_10_38_8]
MKNKFVYFFGEGKADGNGQMKDLLGGKGAGLAEMTNAKIPVPAGFTITTDVCKFFYLNKEKLTAEIQLQISQAVKKLETVSGKKFSNVENPLLVSVRSGAKFSMPGMMDTILNLGLNDKVVVGLAEKTKNPRFAYDAFRRFIQMFGNVVLGIGKEEFEMVLTKKKDDIGAKLDTELVQSDLQDLIGGYKKLIKSKLGKEFPQDPKTQLQMAIFAVFKSWYNSRAETYRKLNKIADDLGTAVNVQAMVFGNLGDDCATGVGFTRNPATGENKFYGEYLTNAQGEDVVAGIRTPQPIVKLAQDMPGVYKQLRDITDRLEKHYRDVQDFEFTIEKEKLFMLQTRIGKRTAQAAIKIAVDMVKEKLITKEEAILRIDPEQINQLLHPILDPKVEKKVIAKGLPASPGAAVGTVVFTADQAVEQGQKGKVILVRKETCPDDIHGMDAAQGVLTGRGGMTSHAAVVARGMGRCCVAGCESIKISEEEKLFKAGDIVIKEGDWISLDGNTGEVIPGKVATVEPSLSGEFGQFMKWADSFRKIGVRANADIPRDAKVAKNFGAEGIGLCRTEHMFFAQDRLPFMQEMILSDTEDDRRVALKKLLKFQKEDFKGLFKEMDGFPVTIRTLDPPLHEFLPKNKKEAEELSKIIKIPVEEIMAKTEALHEFNPMLGHRGCRLGITYPEITEMQVRAIITAACELLKEEKIKVVPEIMIPLVGNVSELKDQKELTIKIAEEVIEEQKVKIQYHIGTMIEVPRAAVTADEIATEAEFFSFGTNDLTQMGMGFSRDDSGKFIKVYLEKKIFADDPFKTLDQNGIGKLIEIGVQKGRSVKPHLKIGICGEHGGDPESIKFCHKVGMNYVSCSPYRVPIARLAAAQASIATSVTRDK